MRETDLFPPLQLFPIDLLGPSNTNGNVKPVKFPMGMPPTNLMKTILEKHLWTINPSSSEYIFTKFQCFLNPKYCASPKMSK